MHSEERHVDSMFVGLNLPDHYRFSYLELHILRWFGRLVYLLVSGLIICSTWGSFEPLVFFNTESFLLVVGGSTALLFATFRWQVIIGSVKAPFRVAVDDETNDVGTAAHVLRTWAVYALACGVLAAILGTIVALFCVVSNNLSKVGPGLAIAIMGLLYSVLLGGLIWTLSKSLPAGGINAPAHARSKWAIAIASATYIVILAYTWSGIEPDGCNAAYLIDPKSISAVILGTAFLAAAGFGLREALTIIWSTFRPSSRCRDSGSRLRQIGIYFVIVGLVACLTGFITILMNVGSWQSLCMSIAVTLFPLLYGILLGLFCWAFAGPSE